MHARILHHLFAVASDGGLAAPLWPDGAPGAVNVLLDNTAEAVHTFAGWPLHSVAAAVPAPAVKVAP